MALTAALWLALPHATALAQDESSTPAPGPVESTSPSFADGLLRVLSLRDYNTRVVLLGTALLGMTAGVVGVFMLLRRRALIGDVVGHAALPGIAGAFLVMQVAAAADARSLPVLLAGAFVTGLASAGCVMLIDRYSRVKSDAALAIVLSAFYGAGAVLLSVVQKLPTGAAAGLNAYLNGKTASLVASDVVLFGITALVILAVTLLLFKEFALLCFDDGFAAADGWPVFLLDALLIGLVGAVTIIGMQSVGVILVVATLIVPAAAARFWTDDVRRLTALSAVIGGLSALVGTAFSAAAPRIAAGATIVLVAGLLFGLSLAFGARRGLAWHWLEQRRLRRQEAQHDLLRALYEEIESCGSAEPTTDARFLETAVELAALSQTRSWSTGKLRQLIEWGVGAGLLLRHPEGRVRLTPAGLEESRRLVRNHRLWEMYLIQYADIAPTHVDRDADLIEHVLDRQIVEELERLVQRRRRPAEMPASPHLLGPMTTS
jgi:manganese/zinc/iron transport system permease protein